MNKKDLISYLKKLDDNLEKETTLYIFGSAVLILLDAEMRISIDIDVAGPYSQVDISDLERACELAGIPLNPDEDYLSDHLEWVGPVRLCLPKPDPKSDMTLWRGDKLSILTSHPAKLIASKLIRYDEIDQSDIHFLWFQFKITFDRIVSAVNDLPEPFKNDLIVQENLENLKADMARWEKRA